MRAALSPTMVADYRYRIGLAGFREKVRLIIISINNILDATQNISNIRLVGYQENTSKYVETFVESNRR